MSDDELAAFLGLEDPVERAAVMGRLTPEERAYFEHMAKVTQELNDWTAGKGPKPRGVIVCRDESRK